MGLAKCSVTYSVKENGRRPPTWNLQSDLSGEFTLADLLRFTKGALIRISSDVLKEEQAKGFDKKPILLVDGKYNRRVTDVNPLGKIQYVAHQNLSEIILHTYKAVWERSPVDTGEYKNSNVVTLNGSQVASNLPALEAWLNGRTFTDRDKIRIVNTAPYARKLELEGIRFGVTKRKWGKPGKNGYQSVNWQGKVKKPNGAYTLAYRVAKAKYGKNVFMKFELLSGSTIGLVGAGRVRKTGRDKGRPYVYPSILIYAVDASGPSH